MQKMLKQIIAAHLGAGAPIIALNLFAEKRMAKFAAGSPGTGAERAPEAAEIAKERTKPFGQLLDENLKNKRKLETAYDPDAQEVAINLAKKTNPPIEAEDILTRLAEGYKAHQNKNSSLESITFKEFWKNLKKTAQVDETKRGPCTKVSLEKEGNEWKFMFRDNQGELLQFGAGEGVAIDATPPATPPATTETQPGETGMRTIDEAAEKAEEEKLKITQKGQEQRNEVYGKTGSTGGKLAEKYKKLTISDLYPDAQKGDKVSIRRAVMGTRVRAEFDGTKWTYVEGENPKDTVKIYANDDIRFTPSPDRRRGISPPEEMKGKRAIGYFRVKQNVSWEDIARTVMCTGEIPRGAEFNVKNTKDTQPDENSPQAILERKGYDPANNEDVKKIAQFLKDLNGSDKLNVWIALPTGNNPRKSIEKQAAEKKQQRIEAGKRRTQEMIEMSDSDHTTYVRMYKTMIENKDIKVPENIAKIVGSTELWNYYWDGKFEGKESIMRGLTLLNIPENKAREIIENAIDQGSNKFIDFEDLLDAFDNKGVVVYTSYKNTNNDFDHFREEWIYQNLAARVSKNIDAGNAPNTGISTDDFKWFEKNKEDFEPGLPDHARGKRKAEMSNIMQACALILDGVTKLDSSITVDTAKQMIKTEKDTQKNEQKAREEAAEKGRNYERPATRPTPEEQYLQRLFHPQEAQALEDVAGTSYDKASGVYGWVYNEDERSYFRRETSDATAYRIIKYNATVDGRLDRNIMVNELNSYIRRALVNFNALPYAEGEENLPMRQHKEQLAQRYGIPPQYLNTQENFMDVMLNYYSIKPDLAPLGSPHDRQVRELINDGFLSSRQMAEGRVEAAGEQKDWLNLNEILNQANNPATREVIQAVLATNPDPKPTEEEIKRAVEELDKQFEQPSNLFDINAGVDTNTGKFMVGLSKSIVEIGGFNLKVGFAVDLQTGRPIIGVMASQEIPMTDQWAAEIQGGAGAEISGQGLKFVGGLRGGFRWTSEGSPTSNYQEVVRLGAGVGGSMAFNLTDIYIGPHIYVEAGQKQNLDNRYQLLMEKQLADTGYANVEAAQNDAEKARAIRSLPAGVGNFLIEAQYNTGWTDRELVSFYENNLKETLQNVTQEFVVEDSSVISEWGLGGSVDPRGLTIMAAAIATANPALIALTVAFYARIGFVIGNKIEVKRELRHDISQKQMEREQEMIKYIESRYPGVEIEISAETLDPSNQLISREFAGDQMERMMGKEQPAKMQMEIFNPPSTVEFGNMQKEFARHHLKLTVDPETKMYALEPTETETYRVFVDSKMQGHSAILKGNKILISSTAGLNQLHIKRFDAFYPGTVDGAVQHTVIAITDNPNRTIGEISAYNSNYFESRYNRKQDLNDSLRLRGPVGAGTQQGNLLTYEQFSALSPAQKAAFANSETQQPEALATAQERELLKANIKQTDRALGLAIMLGENITLDNLPVSPDQFIKKYPVLYRQLSTNPTKPTLNKLDETIKKENPDISQDQMILFKEKLFQKSMSEDQNRNRETTIRNRIDWAEKEIFTPFFGKQIEKLKAKGETIPPHITAESLARQFSSDLKQNLSNKPQELEGGQSIFTAVGTYNIEGIRTLPAVTGQNNELNQFTAGFDYATFLSSKGDALTETHHWIGKLLLEQHSELPTEDKAFLQSRIAKKLFYMGKSGEVPNPLIDIIGSDKFEQLISAYDAIENGKEIDVNNASLKAAIAQFREIAEKIRTAQLEGTPVTIDGKPAKAVQIGKYYFVIETMMMSGVYEYCKNPSTIYNEAIHIFREQIVRDAIVASGSVSSAAADVTTIATKTTSSMTMGLTGVATRTFERGSDTPPPGVEEPDAPAGPGGAVKGEAGEDLGGIETPDTKIPGGSDTGSGSGSGEG